jgi:hypothetical protein
MVFCPMFLLSLTLSLPSPFSFICTNFIGSCVVGWMERDQEMLEALEMYT